VTVSADINGKTQTLGSSKFRIKSIPKPSLKFGGQGGGTMAAANLRAQTKLQAVLEDFVFENVGFTINSFSFIIYNPRGAPVYIKGNGGSLNPQMIGALRNVTPGCSVIFDDVAATGPDGKSRVLNSLSIRAK
jgi:hypothetical protein